MVCPPLRFFFFFNLLLEHRDMILSLCLGHPSALVFRCGTRGAAVTPEDFWGTVFFHHLEGTGGSEFILYERLGMKTWHLL